MMQLVAPRRVVDEIISHCKEVYPNEACGILAGKGGVVQEVYKMRNIEDSAVSYMVAPKEQFAVMKEMREKGLEIVAIYHSHPHSDAYPSPKDIELAFYPESIYLIVSLINKEPGIRAFSIRDEKAEEVEMKIILE